MTETCVILLTLMIVVHAYPSWEKVLTPLMTSEPRALVRRGAQLGGRATARANGGGARRSCKSAPAKSNRSLKLRTSAIHRGAKHRPQRAAMAENCVILLTLMIVVHAYPSWEQVLTPLMTSSGKRCAASRDRIGGSHAGFEAVTPLLDRADCFGNPVRFQGYSHTIPSQLSDTEGCERAWPQAGQIMPGGVDQSSRNAVLVAVTKIVLKTAKAAKPIIS